MITVKLFFSKKKIKIKKNTVKNLNLSLFSMLLLNFDDTASHLHGFGRQEGNGRK